MPFVHALAIMLKMPLLEGFSYLSPPGMTILTPTVGSEWSSRQRSVMPPPMVNRFMFPAPPSFAADPPSMFPAAASVSTSCRSLSSKVTAEPSGKTMDTLSLLGSRYFWATLFISSPVSPLTRSIYSASFEASPARTWKTPSFLASPSMVS